VRTIETIVHAVPTPIWLALAVLSLVALGLAARTFVERRRARGLAHEREQLMKDVAALERALLPAVPERVGAVATSVAFRSCDGPAAGGDFYDAFELPDGRAVVLVGDVSGHGPDALEATNSVRSQLHAFLEAGMSPRAAIAVVGERAPVQLAGRFTTVVVAVHDPEAGTLTFATAGHAPPIIVGPAAEELLSAGASPPIGIDLRTGLRETTVALPPGSLACFYTDGLVEAKARGAMIGRAGLEALVESIEDGDDALTLLERVLAEADEAPDDMAVCLVRPLAGAAALSPRVEVLELDADDVASGFAARFLEACGVPAGGIALAVAEARAAVGASGRAVVEVTIRDGIGRARVSGGAAAPPAAAV
jgi:serine phosphatase RsbU (regulator of sigma subunit)